jgi:hypothetical protein
MPKRVEESIPGRKGLTVYDIADRIGAYLALRPAEVFLHAGTRKGAKALGLDTGSKSLSMSCLPEDLQSVEPEEAEDILCIYREVLARIHHGVGGLPRATANVRRTPVVRCY